MAAAAPAKAAEALGQGTASDSFDTLRSFCIRLLFRGQIRNNFGGRRTKRILKNNSTSFHINAHTIRRYIELLLRIKVNLKCIWLTAMAHFPRGRSRKTASAAAKVKTKPSDGTRIDLPSW